MIMTYDKKKINSSRIPYFSFQATYITKVYLSLRPRWSNLKNCFDFPKGKMVRTKNVNIYEISLKNRLHFPAFFYINNLSQFSLI